MPQQGLDNVFHGDQPHPGAQVVIDHAQVLALAQHFAEHVFNIHGGAERRHATGQLTDLAVALHFQQVALVHVADRFVVFVDHREAGKRRAGQALAHVGHALVRAQRAHHGARGHHLLHLDLVEVEHIGDHPLLVLVQGLLIAADGRHCLELGADIGVRLAGADLPGDDLGQPHERLEHQNHHVQHRRQHGRQTAPELGADGLGNDLGENQDGQRHHRRRRAQIGLAEDHRHLGTDPGGAGGVGDGVEGEDRRQRVVDVVLELAQLLEQLGPLTLEAGDIAGGDRQQGGFQNRAQERKPDGDQGKNDKQKHRRFHSVISYHSSI